MKTILLLLFIFPFCAVNSLLAQEYSANEMLFPQFEKGTVVFKQGNPSSALLNYNMNLQEMQFKGADGVIMAISNISQIREVVINDRIFLPVSTKGMFYEKIPAGTGFFFVQRKAFLRSQGKAAGYGGYSQTSSISSYDKVYGVEGGHTVRLNADEKFSVKVDQFYYLNSGKGFKKFHTAKTLGKLFKGHESQIENFAKEHSTDFSKPDDVSRIVEFGFSLLK